MIAQSLNGEVRFSRAVGRAFCAHSELSLGRSEGGISFGYCCHRKTSFALGADRAATLTHGWHCGVSMPSAARPELAIV